MLLLFLCYFPILLLLLLLYPLGLLKLIELLQDLLSLLDSTCQASLLAPAAIWLGEWLLDPLDLKARWLIDHHLPLDLSFLTISRVEIIGFLGAVLSV